MLRMCFVLDGNAFPLIASRWRGELIELGKFGEISRGSINGQCEMEVVLKMGCDMQMHVLVSDR